MSDQEIVGPASSYYVSQRLKLHFVDWGNEEKPPLLLVHGGQDHARNWDWVARALRKDYHVIAPDLRGHGDSAWAQGGQYTRSEYVLDLAQLIEVLDLAPLRIVAHSMGASISLHYAGVFPENVSKLVAIEGMGIPKQIRGYLEGKTHWQLMRSWIESVRSNASRQPRRYATIDEAAARMQEANPHLSTDQARHLTIHGVARNEDGTFTWKFDNAARAFFAVRASMEESEEIWRRITCPALLIHGSESWHGDPRESGRAQCIPDHRVLAVEDAGHWVHHDQLDLVLAELRAFLQD